MYLAKVEKHQEVILVRPILDQDIIMYQLDMVNCSDQHMFAKTEKSGSALHYTITARLPLELYFRTSCEGYQEIKTLFQLLIQTIQSCEHYLLNNQQLILQKEYIFYDAKTHEIMMLHQPFLSESSVSVHTGVKNILLSLLYEHISFDELVEDYRIKEMILLLQQPTFDMFVFYSYLNNHKHSKKSVKKKRLPKLFAKKKIEKNKTCPKPDNNETVILSQHHFAQLEFGDKIVEINKEIFMIGRSTQLNDFALPKSLSIGRVHAEIFTENASYYVKDLDTKNGTYLNGNKLDSQVKYLLTSGDVLQFANEKAIFK